MLGKGSKELFSIVIPVYNSTNSLVEMADRINEVFDRMLGAENEIIFIDDASPNKETWDVLNNIRKKHKNIRILQLTKNFGQQSATLCGFKLALGDYIISMDDDLQHLPEDIPKLVAEKAHDIVIGQFNQKKHSTFKKITSWMKGWFDYKLIGKPRHIQMSSFRLINRTVVDGILAMATPYPFIPALMFSVSKDIVGVQATHSERKEGTSQYNIRKLILVFSNLIINNSSFLLKLIGIFGIVVAIISFFLALWFVIKKLLFDISIVGWTSIIVSVLFIGGILLFSIGIIGEYLIRIISVVEKKPAYCIRQKNGFCDE